MPCTVEQLAERLQLPLDHLQNLGLTDATQYGGASVRVPYFNERGQETGARFITALDGADRFRWPKKAKIGLYGLSRMAAADDVDHIALVNGEADCFTLWFDNFPGVALPGANAWEEARDAPHFARFKKIFIAVQSGPATTAVLDWLSRSAIRDRALLVTLPEGIDDVATLYQQSPVDFPERWHELLRAAVAYNAKAQEDVIQRRNLAWARARHYLLREDVLAAVYRTCAEHLGIVDEERLAKLVYLAATSRLLDKIVSLIIKGPSATGKSYVVQQVLKLFPKEAYLAFTALSEKALVHSTEPVDHRMLVIYEASGLAKGFLAYTVRSLLSENRLRYSTPKETIDREGPTGLITTTTELALHHENETRCLMITTDDSPEHTAQIMVQQARSWGARRPSFRMWFWHAVQRYLALSPRDVVIPYGEALAGLVPPVASRLRRDISALLSLIAAHALLHQHSRDKDEDGAVIANMRDYEVVRELVGDLITVEAGIGIPAIVRETRQAIDGLRLGADQPYITVKQVARALTLDVSAAWRRVQLAIEHGVVRNLQTRARQPARLVPGDRLPSAANLLPTADEVAAAFNASAESE